MRRAPALIVLVLVTLLVSAGLAAAASDPTDTAVDPAAGRVIVALAPGVSAAARTATVKAATGRSPGERLGDGLYVVDVPPGTEAAAAAALASHADVLAAEPDTVVQLAATPNDPCWTSCAANPYGQADQWGLAAVDAPGAWDVTTGSPSVAVAVVDTGVQAVHPDLAGKVVGASCSPRSAPTTDDNGHGTFVAGIIAALTDNATGIAGLGWDSTILSVKALDQSGSGRTSDIMLAISCALDSGARVINLSIEKRGQDALLDAAVAGARQRGAIVVAAAGNFGDSDPFGTVAPANSPGAIGVAATTKTPPDTLAGFSSRGNWVDVAAPGEDVVSTCSTAVTIPTPGRIYCPGGYAIADGTSFASPLVAAVAALLLAQDPTMSAGAVEARIERTAALTPDVGSRSTSGYLCGRLSAGAALRDDRPAPGYWMVGTNGTVYRFGNARDYGSSSGAAGTVGLAAAPSRCGYWTVDSAGVVMEHGTARHFGDLTGTTLAAPIVAMAATPSGDGYWLLGSDGGIFAFGDAAFFGSTGALKLNAPVTGIASTPSGRGYWLVGRDGGSSRSATPPSSARRAA